MSQYPQNMDKYFTFTKPKVMGSQYPQHMEKYRIFTKEEINEVPRFPRHMEKYRTFTKKEKKALKEASSVLLTQTQKIKSVD